MSELTMIILVILAVMNIVQALQVRTLNMELDELWNGELPGNAEGRERTAGRPGGRTEMRMKMDDGKIYIIEADSKQSARIKSWGIMKWYRKDEMWIGLVSRELLNRLATLVPLPQSIKEERDLLNDIQKAVDEERVLPADDMKPLVKYPVKKKLFAHQVRAANMAALVFGLVGPEEVLKDG